MPQTSPEFLPLTDHFRDLRSALIKSLLIITAGCLISFYFYEPLVAFITAPLNKQGFLIEGVQFKRISNTKTETLVYSLNQKEELLSSGPNVDLKESLVHIPAGEWAEIKVVQRDLALLEPSEGFLSVIKIVFWSSLILLAPLWLLPFVTFLKPALYEAEEKLVVPFFVLSLVFVLAGLLFCYAFTLPLAIQYFYEFNNGIGFNFWSLSAYIDFSLSLYFGHMIGFECAAILFLLVFTGVLSADMLRKKRAHALIVCLILGAAATPPDIPSQLLAALPIYALFELCIAVETISQLLRRSSRSYRDCRDTLSTRSLRS